MPSASWRNSSAWSRRDAPRNDMKTLRHPPPEGGTQSVSPRKEETVSPNLSRKPKGDRPLAPWRLRRLCAAVKERPIRLLSIVLFLVGSCAAMHFGGISLLVLIVSPPIWDEILRPILFVGIPVTVTGISLLWLSLHLWNPSRKVRPHFLLWLLAATIVYTIAFVVWLSLFSPGPPMRSSGPQPSLFASRSCPSPERPLQFISSQWNSTAIVESLPPNVLKIPLANPNLSFHTHYHGNEKRRDASATATNHGSLNAARPIAHNKRSTTSGR
jgi:hypothetical protein